MTENSMPPRKPATDRLQPALYQAVWRWHFYAGLMFAPILIILAFSGAVYLFKPQIEGIMYKDMLTVRETGLSPMSTDELIARTQQEYPGTIISSLTLTDNPASTVKIATIRDGAPVTMFVNPYTGEINGLLRSDKTFAAFFKKMHSQLVVGGTWANRLVELAACWAFILVITGLYLWFPRHKLAVWGTILPRLGKPFSRQFWRDLHVVPAFWLSIFILILIATGLPWTSVTGSRIDRVANATYTNYPPYALSFMAKPESTTVARDVADDIPWAAPWKRCRRSGSPLVKRQCFVLPLQITGKPAAAKAVLATAEIILDPFREADAALHVEDPDQFLDPQGDDEGTTNGNTNP